MSSTPVPDEQTYYSSRRRDDVDALAWPVFSQRALDLLRSAGEVLHPGPGELLWDTGETYDLYLVLAGGVLLLDRRDDRVVFVVEEGDFVGELGMLMGQRAFLLGVAMEETAVLRVRVEELRRLVAISGELSDVLLSAFDARRRLLTSPSGARPAARPGSRTTSAFPWAWPGQSWRGARCCRRSSSGRGWCPPAPSRSCRRCPEASASGSTTSTTSWLAP
jgi:hypothetical protein